MITRRQALVGAAALPMASVAAASQAVTLLVGAKPGAASDVMARAFVPFLARRLPDVEFRVVNLPRSAGYAALQELARAEPTGNVIGWVATPTLPARMVARGADDLLQRISLIAAVEKEPIAIVSPAATPLSSVQDIVAKAAEDA